jgi:capsular polysaccharide biosynthesis protein
VTIAATDTDGARAARVVGALSHMMVDKNVADNTAIDEQDRRLSQSSQNAVRTPRLIVTSLDCAAPSGGLTSAAVLPNCPSPPATPNGPRVKLTALAGLVLGGVLGLVVVMGAAALDDSLKGQEDVRHYLNLPVIASIPHRRAPSKARE